MTGQDKKVTIRSCPVPGKEAGLMTKNRNQHVVPAKDGWAVRRAGSSKATKMFGTQREAIERGREIARKQGSELLIHGRDGRIREKSTYGRDEEWERSQADE